MEYHRKKEIFFLKKKYYQIKHKQKFMNISLIPKNYEEPWEQCVSLL